MFLSDVKQEMLETIVPKGDSESIMVVLGEQRGQVSKAAVQVRCLLLTVSKAVMLVCCSRWAVFFRGTRTNAERWFSSTDTRRKCSRWTMTPFVTTSEGQIVDFHNLSYCFVTFDILTPCSCLIKLWKGFMATGFTAAVFTTEKSSFISK